VVQIAQSLAKENRNSKVKILNLVRNYYEFDSVADLGCGRAGWLSAARALGASVVHGYDIPEIDVVERQIEPEEFTPTDLSQPITFDRRFDMAISTEVAEHIPPDRAQQFVENLVNAAPLLIFSAATPYQGGLGHVNENWVEYWDALFRKYDYVCFDFVRDAIWHDPAVPFYYRQNILVYAAPSHVQNLEDRGLTSSQSPKSLIHPDMFLKAVHRTQSIDRSKHDLARDVLAYYGELDEFADAKIENQGYGDRSFRK
jgi:hypothetical protein